MHFLSFATASLAALSLLSLAPVLAAPIPSDSALCKKSSVQQRNAIAGSHKSHSPSDSDGVLPLPTVSIDISIGLPTSTSHKGKPTATGAASSDSSSHVKSSATATATGSVPTSSSSSGSSSDARFVIYTDSYVNSKNGLPSADDVTGFTHLALSFLLASGPADQAQQWTTLSASDRAAALNAYHDAGVKVIVSAFGSTETPTTSGTDPASAAGTMAAWVKKYGLDGIDVDYEDMEAFDNQPKNAIAWLNTFTKTLRDELPAGQYTISHAPVAPWFSKTSYAGGYLAIDEAVGDSIDWYNIQFYNQGEDMYTTCDGLLNTAGSSFPKTSLFEIANAGVPLNKLVIGKPAGASDAANGFIAQAELAGCVAQAQGKGWNAGVMTWEYPSAKASWVAAVRGDAFPL